MAIDTDCFHANSFHKIFYYEFITRSIYNSYDMTKIRNTIAYIQTIKIAKSELQPSDHINKSKDKGSALFIPDYKIVIGIIISDNYD